MNSAAKISLLTLLTLCFTSAGFSQVQELQGQDSRNQNSKNSTAKSPENAEHSAVRIGIYDSRAIAIAWAPSKHNSISEKMKELEAAKKANDSKRIAELENWGKSQQQVLHFQGFGRVPVSDLLKPVHEPMKQLMADKRLSAITMQCDLVAEGVELVDVTNDLVNLYEPSERRVKWVEQLRDKPALSLAELMKLDPEK